MNENDKLHDALERQSELIKALRNEIATKDKRIKELEQAHDSRGLGALAIVEKHLAQIEALVNEKKAQRDRIEELEAENAQRAQTILYLTAQCQECVEQLQADGRMYSEGCKPC